MIPILRISGGLYYAAAVLAPPGYGPLAAWITGWSNWIGQVTGAPSVNYGISAMILACGSIQNPSYVPTNYQTFLLTTLTLAVCPPRVYSSRRVEAAHTRTVPSFEEDARRGDEAFLE